MTTTLALRPSTNDLWARAAAELSDEDRGNINFSHPDKLNILSDLLRLTEQSKQECIQKKWQYTRKNGEAVAVVDFFNKLVKWIDLFKQVGDAAVQYDPVHAALPWAGVRFLLQIAVNDFTRFAFLVEGTASIAEIICRCAIIEDVYLQSTSQAAGELKRALVQLYGAIMIYLSKAKSYFHQSSAKRIIKSGLLAKSDLDSSFGAIVTAQETVDRCSALFGLQDQIERHTELRRLLKHIDSPLQRLSDDFGSVKGVLAQARIGVDELVSTYNDESLQKVYDWLSPLAGEFENKQLDTFNLNGRQDRLGYRLLRTTEFKKWMSGPGENLWCCGEPGVGKTVLASFVIDSLQQKNRENPDIGIAFIFCNYKDVSKQTPVNLIASLLHQLVLQKAILQGELTALHKSHIRNKTRPTLGECTKLLQAAVDRFSKVHIVIDALDECSEVDQARQDLLEAIGKLNRVNVLVTSRNIPIDGQLRNPIRWDVKADDLDIKNYLEERMSRSDRIKKFAEKDSTLYDAIKHTILEKANGMFLLAFLHLESLVTKNDLRSLKDALNSLPEGLDTTYDRTMERIKAQSSDDFELARKVIYWVNYALRPLALREIQEALAVRPGDHDLDEDGIPEEERLLSVCAGLVTIQQESQTIILVHHTTQEYFKRQGVKYFPHAQADILTICLTYLSFDIFKEGPCGSDEELEERLQKYPFLEYAAMYWGNHFSRDLGGEAKHLVLGFLEEDLKMSCSIQILHGRISQQSREQNQRHKQFKNSQHSLHTIHKLWLAAYFNLTDVIEVMSQKGIDVLTKTGYGETALHPAARCGNSAVVKLLLRAGADINAVNESGDSALLIAALQFVTAPARSGHEIVIQMLIEEGADIAAKDGSGLTTLHWMAVYGLEEVVQLLLERGADVDAVDNNGKTALHFAAVHGHEAVVLLLIERGADIEIKDNSEGTPLYHAAIKGYEVVVRLLLEKGAEITAKWYGGGTMLHFTAAFGHEVLVRLLLEKGADIETKDNRGGTALQWAVMRGHEVVVRLLLEKGADIETKDNIGGTALHWAAEDGQEAVARLLLEKGVGIETKDNSEKTALHYAASNGHETVVQLLLEKGADIEAKDINDASPVLHWAAAGGDEAVVRLLLEKGANIEARDNARLTALHWAAECGHVVVAQLLLDNGAAIEAKDNEGQTALYRAAWNGHEAVERLLLENGALEIDDFYGLHALFSAQWAKDHVFR